MGQDIFGRSCVAHRMRIGLVFTSSLFQQSSNKRHIFVRLPSPYCLSPSISPHLAGDLSRYFGGDVSLPSVTAHTVEHYDAPGVLSAKRFDEEDIAPERRLPRLTSASWKYVNGAVGALTHVIALHGERLALSLSA